MEMNVQFLFGLEFQLIAMCKNLWEMLMNSSFVNSYVWCGLALLRSPGGIRPIQMRDRYS